jgi:hypothetical protein
MSACRPGAMEPNAPAVLGASAACELAETLAARGSTPRSRTRLIKSSALRP